MYRTAAALVMLAPSIAFAATPRIDLSWKPSVYGIQTEEEPGAAATEEPKPEKTGRQFLMEVNFRGRYVFVPQSIFSIWYYNEDDDGWADSRDAPRIHGYALGLEFVIKGDSANGIFYVEWIESMVTEGYWDDKEEPPDHLDGDYLVPTENLGMVVGGADYAYEVHMVRTEKTNGAFGMSFLVGGGLGIGVMLGHFDRWGPGPDGTPANVRYDAGDPSDGEKDIPKVFPMVDINAGFRFNFGDRVVLRLEGGLHTMIYGGGALGVMF